VDDPADITFGLNQGGVRVSAIQKMGENLEDYYTKLIGGDVQ
jgi:hypothetical protein